MKKKPANVINLKKTASSQAKSDRQRRIEELLELYRLGSNKDYDAHCQRASATREIESLLAKERRLWKGKVRAACKGTLWRYDEGMTKVYFLISHGRRPLTGIICCSARVWYSSLNSGSGQFDVSGPWEQMEGMLSTIKAMAQIKENP